MLHKIVLVWILFVIASYSQANVWYYGSGEAVNLENNIGFDKHGQKIITGDTDAPNVVAKSAAKGSIYLQLGGGVFYKTDNGSSTNWSLIPGSYSGTAPINISGTTISCDTATSLVPGCLSAADWSTFNSKVGGSGTAGQVSYWDGASSQAGENDFTWDATNNILTAEKLKTAYSYPAADSVTALQTRKADGATIVTNIDTTNSTFRIGTGALGTATNSQFQVKGLDNGLTASRTAMTFGNGGYAAPSNLNTESNGDKWVFWNSNTYKGAIGFDSYEMWFQSTSTAPASTNKFRFFGGQASAPVDLLKFGTGSSLGYVWNEAGLDLDYRLEGDTDSNMFFLDASTDKLGLGNNSPDFKLDVNGDIRVQDASKIYFGGTGDADNDVNLYRSALNLLKTDDSFETVEMRLASNSQVTAIQGSPAASASATYYMPPADGGANSVLSTNGAGTLSWATPVLTLDNLTDVILTSPVTSQILQYNGTDWINVPYVAPVASGGVSLFLDDTANAHFGAGYITLSQAPVAGATDTDTINTTTANVEVQYGLPTAYATTNALGVTSIPAGMWDLRLYADVDSAVGVSTMRVEVIKKATGGAETVLFSFVTPEMNSSTPTLISVDYAAPAIAVLATDYLAVRVYAVSTSANRTFRFYHNGTTQYTNISTPLGNAHNFLDGLQGCATNECYHLSSAEKTGTGTGNFVRETSPTIATPTITTSATIPTVQGSTTASGNLTIRSTSDATKGTVTIDSDTTIANAKKLTFTSNTDKVTSFVGSGSAADAAYILPPAVGATGTILSTTNTGTLSWVANNSQLGRNHIDNGNFDYWQRGTSLAAGGALVDRFVLAVVTATASQSRQSFTPGQTDVPYFPKYYYRVATTTGSAATDRVHLTQYLDESMGELEGAELTLSFWAKSAAAKNISLSWTQEFGTGGSTRVNTPISTVTTTTSWAKYTVTFTPPSISGKTVGTGYFTLLKFWFDCGANFATECSSLGYQSDTFDIAQVKLEVGPAATNFSRAGGDLAGELIRCQKYYEKSYDLETPPGTSTVVGASEYWAFTTSFYTHVPFKVTKNIIPGVTIYSTTGAASNFRDITAGSDLASTTQAVGQSGFTAVTNASSTANHQYGFHWVVDASY